MIVVDVETGGLDPLKNPLLSIGAVDQKTTSQFYYKIKPLDDMIITNEAVAVNGYNSGTWNGVELASVMTWFIGWLDGRDCILAGHNPSFDNSFLKVNFERVGIKSPFRHRTIDMHTLAYQKFGKSLTSDQIYEALGMQSEPKPHIAITGAKMESEAFRRLGLG